jgi:GNAT superfamily N-acetyltransferase
MVMRVVERSEVELRILSSGDDLIPAVFDLGERHKGWLGMLAPAVYEENAAAGRILVAVADEQLLGYAMFYLARRRVRLAHLCVEPDERGNGIARKLVDDLSRRHADLDGISLKCRREWPATKAWPKLGFEARSNKAGRSAAGHLLTAWWRDHGHPDLFSTLVDEQPRIVTAIDTNVFRDLHEPNRGDGAAQSQSLEAEWLEGELELVLTPATSVELNQVADTRLRERLLGTAQSGHYRIIGRPPAAGTNPADALEKAIIAGIPATILKKDASLRADARLLAEAECGGAAAFVTRDENAVEHLTIAAAPFTDIWISTPTDLIVHLDEARDALNYTPVRLRDTGYTIAETEARAEDDLRALLNHADGERAGQFRLQVRAAAQAVGDTGARRLVRDPAGNVVAAAFFATDGEELTVSLLRVKESALAPTLANHLLHLLRTEANARQVATVTVNDPRLTHAVASSLDIGGFRRQDDRWVLDFVRGIRTWNELEHLLPGQTLDEAARTAQMAADLEKAHWPLKVRDSNLPCYLVPIRPEPAGVLFGQEQALWEADAELGLSRQHVYYKAPRPGVLTAPGRILWYISGNVKEALAVSRIDQVVVAHPGTLYRRFRRLGALGSKAIADQARDGKAMAVRFGDTEFFSRPIPLARLRAMNSRLVPPPSPREITEEDFFRVYEEGQPR